MLPPDHRGAARARPSRRRRATACAAVALALAAPTAALEVRLTWTPVSGAVGYRIHARDAAAAWTSVRDVGAPAPEAGGLLRHLATALPADSAWFAVSAYDAEDRSSAPSNEVPLPPSVPRDAIVSGVIAHQPSGMPLPSAAVRLRGAAGAIEVATHEDGSFAISVGAGGVWELAAQVAEPTNAAAGALDAAWVLQAVAGLRRLTPDQAAACDVTGNGALSALDATFILQHAVGALARLPVAERCASDWLLLARPAAADGQRVIAPLVDASSCAAAAVAYEPLSGDAAAQNFVAMPFGDCTGNWRPARVSLGQSGDGGLELGVAYRRSSGRWAVPLIVSATDGFNALEARLALDTPLLEVRPLGVTRDAVVVALPEGDGLRLAIAAVEALPGDGRRVALLIFAAAAVAPTVRILDAAVDDLPVATTLANQ